MVGLIVPEQDLPFSETGHLSGMAAWDSFVFMLPLGRAGRHLGSWLGPVFFMLTLGSLFVVKPCIDEFLLVVGWMRLGLFVWCIAMFGQAHERCIHLHQFED